MAAETKPTTVPGFRKIWYLGIVSIFIDISFEMILRGRTPLG